MYMHTCMPHKAQGCITPEPTPVAVLLSFHLHAVHNSCYVLYMTHTYAHTYKHLPVPVMHPCSLPLTLNPIAIGAADCCLQVLPDGAPGVRRGGEIRRQDVCCRGSAGIAHYDRECVFCDARVYIHALQRILRACARVLCID